MRQLRVLLGRCTYILKHMQATLTCRPAESAFSYTAACCASEAPKRSSARSARPHSVPTHGQLRRARAYTALMTAWQDWAQILVTGHWMDLELDCTRAYTPSPTAGDRQNWAGPRSVRRGLAGRRDSMAERAARCHCCSDSPLQHGARRRLGPALQASPAGPCMLSQPNLHPPSPPPDPIFRCVSR